MKLYEAMFLLDNERANKDWDAAAAQVHEILERHGCSIAKSEKWGERKLAYEIAGHTRATYMLVHFEAEPATITPIRRDAGLSDTIIRSMILVDTDGLDAPDMHSEALDERDKASRRSEGGPPKSEGGDKPAEDKPAEDKPAEDKPAEDKPAEDKPAEDKPAQQADDEPKTEATGEASAPTEQAKPEPEPPAEESDAEKPQNAEKPTEE